LSPFFYICRSITNFVFKIPKIYFIIFGLCAIIVIPAYSDPIVKPSSDGTIKVGFETDPIKVVPGDQTQIKINFINQQGAIQQHIDYKISVMNGGNQVVGGIPTSHTAEGAVSIPFQFQTAGTYQIIVEIDGILFQPIPPETAIFSLNVGTSSNQTGGTIQIPSWVKTNAKYWHDGSIDDSTFAQGIQYMIKQGIITIPPTPSGQPKPGVQIPAWIKNNAGYWATGNIDDATFVKGIQYLIMEGIIQV
jgi:hypothetical protein